MIRSDFGGRERFAVQVGLRDLSIFSDVRGLWSFLALYNLELHNVAFLQALITFTADRTVVDEHVGSAFASNKSVTLGVIEPLHCTFQAIHVLSSGQRPELATAHFAAILRPVGSSVNDGQRKESSSLLWNSVLAGTFPGLLSQPEHTGNGLRVLDGSF